ncbi:MAG: hypothetical protein GF414_01555 [Candidatus Altiarchaeales archaeon]|nr:hypothetical protein [Candidatus Altiarchaeales archaeon]
MMRDYLMHELMEAGCIGAGTLYEKTYPGPESICLLTHDKLDYISSQIRAAYDEITGKIDMEEISLDTQIDTPKTAEEEDG